MVARLYKPDFEALLGNQSPARESQHNGDKKALNEQGNGLGVNSLHAEIEGTKPEEQC